ncbi:hypothetical protein GDO81_028167 [Engystomops pustulosus]|uniref:UPAR/Ly6 domain-containing protein n=1 Tax=Engystomops pustulosus TaxID=76066 RepID=A0AAV6ZM70_ENGPU|nr:hypothetical protein GDO81_028167 [Engystomops pustulosus]
MKSFYGFLSLFSTLIATSSALSCTQCASPGSSSCSGSDTTCVADNQCGSLYIKDIQLGGDISEAFVRTCVLPSNCGFQGSITNGQRSLRAAISCCNNTDSCVPTTPSLPEVGTTPNGAVCPSCISIGALQCSSSDTYSCKGNENMCILGTAQIPGLYVASMAVRGCGTKSFCDLGKQYLPSLSLDFNFQCSSSKPTTVGTTMGTTMGRTIQATTNGGNHGTHKVLLTSATVCLLLLRFFF